MIEASNLGHPQSIADDPLEGREPDYTGDRLEELYEVRQRIDAQRFPERAERLSLEIARKERELARRATPVRRHALFASRLTIASVQMSGGMFGVVSVLSELGYGNRFGVVYVDFKTQNRTPKMSASFLREVARRNAVA